MGLLGTLGREGARRVPSGSVALFLGLLAVAQPMPVAMAAAPAPSGQESGTDQPAGPTTVDPDIGGQAGADRITFGVQPATTLGGNEQPGFFFEVPPGSVVFDEVAVLNYSDDAVDLDVYAADATTSRAGDFAVGARAAPLSDVGAWLTVGEPTDRVTVDPETPELGAGRVILPVAIQVPPNAEPGDHAGAVVVSLTTESRNPEGQNVRLEQRVAARVYLRVSGEQRPSLVVTDLTATYEPARTPWDAGAVEVTYTLVNTGNIRMAVEPLVGIRGPFGLGAQQVESETVPEVLPRSSVTRTERVSGVWPLIRYGVTVEATPAAALLAAAPELGPVEGSTSVWAWPWYLVVALLIILVTIVIIAMWRRRKRRREGAAMLRPPDSPPMSSAKRGQSTPEEVTTS